MSNTDNLDPYNDNEIISETSLHGSRKAIARHLMDSYKNKVHASGAKYIDIEKLLKFKKDIGKGSVVDHFYRAVALSLSEKRELNATFDGSVYKIFKNINLSIAQSAFVSSISTLAGTFMIIPVGPPEGIASSLIVQFGYSYPLSISFASFYTFMWLGLLGLYAIVSYGCILLKGKRI